MTPLGEAEGRAPIAPAVSAAARHFASGDSDAALRLLSPLIATGNAPLDARFLLGMMAWKMGRLDGALALVRECHDQDPMDGTVAEALASLYAQCGDAVESIYIAKLATALGGYGGLAVLIPEGFPPFELAYAAIAEQPQRARAQRDLAAGRFDDALEHARQHVALEGADHDGRAFYAGLLLRAGRAAEAVEEMRPIEDEASRVAPLPASMGAASPLPGSSPLPCAGTARLWRSRPPTPPSPPRASPTGVGSTTLRRWISAPPLGRAISARRQNPARREGADRK